MLCREIIAVCSEIRTKHIKTAVQAERRIAEFYKMWLGSEALMEKRRWILSNVNGR